MYLSTEEFNNLRTLDTSDQLMNIIILYQIKGLLSIKIFLDYHIILRI